MNTAVRRYFETVVMLYVKYNVYLCNCVIVEWQRGCTVGETSSGKQGSNSRNFERERDSSQWGERKKEGGLTREKDNRTCHAFQRGDCRYGNDCRYMHQQTNMPPSSSSEGFTQQQPLAVKESSEPTTTTITTTKKMKCPPGLFRSRDFLFKGISLAQRKNIVMDKVASFSVTESQMADNMTNKILEFAEQVKPHDNVMFDGMACVGK